MLIRAIIFDRDGVLTYFDTDAATAFFRPILPISIFELAQRWQAWGEAVGFPATLAKEQVFLRTFWEHIGLEFRLTPSQLSSLLALDYARFIEPFPEVKQTLRSLRARGLLIGVLSNFSLASLQASLSTAGLGDLIDVACAATVIGAAKPAVVAYQITARRLGVEPDHCLLFDDEPECVIGGQKAGIQSFLVDRRRRTDALEQGIVCNLDAVEAALTLAST